jgi:hypothetical protein
MDSSDSVGNHSDRSSKWLDSLPLDVLEKLLSHTKEENNRLRSETGRMEAALLERVPPEYSLLKQRRDALEKKMTSLQREKQHLVMELLALNNELNQTFDKYEREQADLLALNASHEQEKLMLEAAKVQMSDTILRVLKERLRADETQGMLSRRRSTSAGIIAKIRRVIERESREEEKPLQLLHPVLSADRNIIHHTASSSSSPPPPPLPVAASTAAPAMTSPSGTPVKKSPSVLSQGAVHSSTGSRCDSPKAKVHGAAALFTHTHSPLLDKSPKQHNYYIDRLDRDETDSMMSSVSTYKLPANPEQSEAKGPEHRRHPTTGATGLRLVHQFLETMPQEEVSRVLATYPPGDPAVVYFKLMYPLAGKVLDQHREVAQLSNCSSSSSSSSSDGGDSSSRETSVQEKGALGKLLDSVLGLLISAEQPQQQQGVESTAVPGLTSRTLRAWDEMQSGAQEEEEEEEQLYWNIEYSCSESSADEIYRE